MGELEADAICYTAAFQIERVRWKKGKEGNTQENEGDLSPAPGVLLLAREPHCLCRNSERVSCQNSPVPTHFSCQTFLRQIPDITRLFFLIPPFLPSVSPLPTHRSFPTPPLPHPSWAAAVLGADSSPHRALHSPNLRGSCLGLILPC